jgi:hypothetical protein
VGVLCSNTYKEDLMSKPKRELTMKQEALLVEIASRGKIPTFSETFHGNSVRSLVNRELIKSTVQKRTGLHRLTLTRGGRKEVKRIRG